MNGIFESYLDELIGLTLKDAISLLSFNEFNESFGTFSLIGSFFENVFSAILTELVLLQSLFLYDVIFLFLYSIIEALVNEFNLLFLIL